jgi:hypothetical protein
MSLGSAAVSGFYPVLVVAFQDVFELHALGGSEAGGGVLKFEFCGTFYRRVLCDIAHYHMHQPKAQCQHLHTMPEFLSAEPCCRVDCYPEIERIPS